jgi:hypothetical protein
VESDFFNQIREYTTRVERDWGKKVNRATAPWSQVINIFLSKGEVGKEGTFYLVPNDIFNIMFHLFPQIC